MTTKKSASIGLWIAAGVAIVFGVLTIVSGGLALFGGPAAQAAAGNAVPFVLWFNFVSGFVYVLAGIEIALRKPWSGTLATALALSIIAVFALFGWHVYRGGAYEMRTMGAMVLRAAIWIVISIFLLRLNKIKSAHVAEGN
jgi:voltage-gated potassium channel Kch